MAPKAKTKTAHTEQTNGIGIYRCRYCSQLFLTSAKPAPPGAWPMYAWHSGSCLCDAAGYGDFAAIIYPGHEAYPTDGGQQ